MYPQKTTSKSIIRWCKPVHLIVIDLVDSGACSGRKILTSLVYERYNVSTGLAAVCGNFVASHVQIQRGIGDWGSAPNETMICVLVEDLDQPGAQGSCYTTLSAGPLNSYQVPI